MVHFNSLFFCQSHRYRTRMRAHAQPAVGVDAGAKIGRSPSSVRRTSTLRCPAIERSAQGSGLSVRSAISRIHSASPTERLVVGHCLCTVRPGAPPPSCEPFAPAEPEPRKRAWERCSTSTRDTMIGRGNTGVVHLTSRCILEICIPLRVLLCSSASLSSSERARPARARPPHTAPMSLLHDNRG